MPEITAADPQRSIVQRAYRHDHAAREEQARKQRQRQSCEQQYRRPGNRSIKRSIGLIDRQIDEQQPVERTDRRVCAQYGFALAVDRCDGVVFRRGIG